MKITETIMEDHKTIAIERENWYFTINIPLHEELIVKKAEKGETIKMKIKVEIKVPFGYQEVLNATFTEEPNWEALTDLLKRIWSFKKQLDKIYEKQG